MHWLSAPHLSSRQHRLRRRFVQSIIVLLLSILVARLISLQVFDGAFLKTQGKLRTLRTLEIPSYRGVITDRRGEPLAVSTPVDSVWLNPQQFESDASGIAQLESLLGLKQNDILEKVTAYPNRHFLYLKRDVTPNISFKVKQLGVPGVHLKREFKRYYPAGPETAQLVGFTNIDDQGLSGLELGLEKTLKPHLGKIRVLEDRAGRWMQDVESIKVPKPGQDIALSIDLRIQTFALKALQETVDKTKAKSGTVVMLDTTTGEVLALVSAPSFNPNNRAERTGPNTRARALTDQLEPGSTAKPFSLLSALSSGEFEPDSVIETHPGYYSIGKNVVRDVSNNGTITLKQILSKSSNIGISKVTLALPPEQLIETFAKVGFGTSPLTFFPGESAGLLNGVPRNPFELATLAFGYGFTVTPLQLTQAYAIIANQGCKRPISLLKVEQPTHCEPLFAADAAKEIMQLLTEVVEGKGTGSRARIKGYQTAGKTGTTRVVGPQGYDPNRHMSFFAGITPAHNPRLATVVILEEPKGQYYGGLIAAPLYAKVVGGALHLLNITPDAA